MRDGDGHRRCKCETRQGVLERQRMAVAASVYSSFGRISSSKAEKCCNDMTMSRPKVCSCSIRSSRRRTGGC